MHGKSGTEEKRSLAQLIWLYMSGDKSAAAGVLATLMHGWVSGYISRVKRKAQRYAVAIALAVASITVIIYGIGSILGSIFPGLPPGTGHVAAGMVFLLVGWAYARSV